MENYYLLDITQQQMKRERAKAQKLKKSQWWLDKKARGVCEYCGLTVGSALVTMDHRVPIARGGMSSKSNVVAACTECNQRKGLHTPVDILLRE